MKNKNNSVRASDKGKLSLRRIKNYIDSYLESSMTGSTSSYLGVELNEYEAQLDFRDLRQDLEKRGFKVRIHKNWCENSYMRIYW